jgi:antitoxin component YwqK of YwqJK toxin-antitoxin module
MIICIIWFLNIIPPASKTAKESIATAPTISVDQNKIEDSNKKDAPKESPAPDKTLTATKDNTAPKENNQANAQQAKSSTNKNIVRFQLDRIEPPTFYEGEVDKNGIPNGQGKFTYTLQDETHTIYEGQLKNGKYDGKGTLYKSGSEDIDFSGIFNNGESVYYPYENEFYYNLTNHVIEFNGEPGKIKTGSTMVVYYPGGNKFYEGGWKNNQVDGKGTIYFLNGKPREVGTFKNGGLNGPGKKYLANGYMQEGSFLDDELDGKAKIYYENGKLSVEGKFKKGKLMGDYKDYYENGKPKSEGTYDDGMFKEYGRYGDGVDYYENGKVKYKGEFKDSTYDGKGTSFNENGDIIQKGKWEKGVFIK